MISPTMQLVQSFWAIDIRLAQRKHFPSISWLESWSRYKKTALQPFYDEYDEEFVNARSKLEEILAREEDLKETVQLVGKVCCV